MALEIEGKVILVLPEQSGTSQAGKTWRKQSFVIETEEQYPKKVIFNVWNDMVDTVKQLSSGEKVKVLFRVESRQFNERWYTDLTAWKITKIITQDLGTGGNNNNTQQPVNTDDIYEQNNTQTDNTRPPIDDIAADNDDSDDLPF